MAAITPNPASSGSTALATRSPSTTGKARCTRRIDPRRTVSTRTTRATRAAGPTSTDTARGPPRARTATERTSGTGVTADATGPADKTRTTAQSG